MQVAPGNLHHQAQIAFDHPLAAGIITLLCQTCVVHLFLGTKQGRKADFREIETGGIHLRDGYLASIEVGLLGRGCVLEDHTGILPGLGPPLHILHVVDRFILQFPDPLSTS